ncbi:MAG: DUF6186 family protein [Acidimicrobiales bacterium]
MTVPVVGWLVLAVVTVAALPTLRAAVRAATASTPSRLAVVAAWAWLGVHLFAR